MEAATIDAAGAERLRAHLHRLWGTVAGAWEEHAGYADERGAPVTAALLSLARLAPGERALELASAAGGVGIAAAGLVGPTGEVVVSDVAPEMTAIARRRVAALGLENVRTRDLDLEAIDEPGESFDAVLCREGLMLVPDPARAAAEIRRVLRPGGRAAVAVWGPRDRNPWLGIVFDAVAETLGEPVPPPGIPGPFSLDDAERLACVLAGAGLTAVEVHEVDVPYRAATVGEWWTRTSALAGPLAQRLAGLPKPARRSLLERAARAVEPYRSDDGIELPGVSLVAAAIRA
ncbi:MAG TPA: class I SAM-dependent methyltransferase [Gaiellaceae bacterium]|nr:class I SAM-dependent methyltransferase [Gaiellaceae bacterium]